MLALHQWLCLGPLRNVIVSMVALTGGKAVTTRKGNTFLKYLHKNMTVPYTCYWLNLSMNGKFTLPTNWFSLQLANQIPHF